MIRIAALLLVGFATWLLVFLRAYALDHRKAGLLCFVIFLDEAVGISTGVWLARNGLFVEILAVAAGGALAAWVSIKIFRRNDRVNINNSTR